MAKNARTRPTSRMLIVSIVSSFSSFCFQTMRARYRHPSRGSPLCFSQHSGLVAPNRSDFRNAQRNSFTDPNNSIISARASATLIRVS
jgi:hypothetical protein